ncbi:MAG TPA: lysylphosphatidylglycerol synthase domain-containing protein [Magnetospirillum sp.]|nr:lysylphosphatidylglycerol synthase domain-containing protein [Magnetospirillum sp.]
MANWRVIMGRPGWPAVRRVAAGLLSVAVFLLALAVLHRALGRVDLHQVVAIATSYPASRLVVALLLALASYVALGGFDWLGLHHIRRSLPVASTMLVSFVSHAVSHNAGFAVLTGGSVRLRMYATFGLGLADVGGIVAFAGLSFGLGVAIVASTAFIVEGARLAPLLKLPPTVVTGLGWCGLGLLAAYFTWTAAARRPLAIGRWRLATPSLPLAGGQVAVAAADLALVAAALYLLLPMDGTGISYPAFVGLYVVATTAGTLSHVPGGLGVFEGALTILIPAPAAEILAALLVFRVFYNLVPLCLAALILAVFELVQRTRHMPQPAWVEGLGPALAALLAFVGGLLLLWSGAGTNAPSSDAPWMAESTHILSGGVGGVLLVLPWGLMAQTRWSYRLAVTTMVCGAVLALMRGPDWAVAAALALAAAALAAAAPLFRAESCEGQAIPWGWLGASTAVLVGATWMAWRAVGQEAPLATYLTAAADGRFLRTTVTAVLTFIAAAWQLRQGEPRKAAPFRQAEPR